MFGEKCQGCGKYVRKKHNFCANCGYKLNGESSLGNEEYGFLGKDNDFDIKLPFGLKTFMKPIMKELSKQMLELNRELKKEQNPRKDNNYGKSIDNFSIHIGMPGTKPIRIDSRGLETNTISKEEIAFHLPKISSENLNKAKELPRKEAHTNVRRLSDRVIYEVELPNVNSISDVNVSVLEDGIEIKALGKNVVYRKIIDVVLPLKGYKFKEGLLVLELGLK